MSDVEKALEEVLSDFENDNQDNEDSEEPVIVYETQSQLDDDGLTHQEHLLVGIDSILIALGFLAGCMLVGFFKR